MPNPEIRLWPFRSLDPIPNPLPDDPDELKSARSVWVSPPSRESRPQAARLMQLVVAAQSHVHDYPGEELLGEIADTEPRNKYQTSAVIQSTRAAISSTSPWLKLSAFGSPSYGSKGARMGRSAPFAVRRALSRRFGAAKIDPTSTCPYGLPRKASSACSTSGGQSSTNVPALGGNFAVRATRVATIAAASFLECLIEDGEPKRHRSSSSGSSHRHRDLQFIGADSCIEISSAIDRIRRAQHTLTELYRGKPRRATVRRHRRRRHPLDIVIHPPLQPQRRLYSRHPADRDLDPALIVAQRHRRSSLVK